MKKYDLSKMLGLLGICKSLDFQERCRLKVAPNMMKFPSDDLMVIECERSSSGEDFSIAQGSIKAGLDWVRSKLARQAIVLLLDEGDFVNQMDVNHLAIVLAGITPQQSKKEEFGPYWWVDDQFHYSGGRPDGSRNEMISDIPY